MGSSKRNDTGGEPKEIQKQVGGQPAWRERGGRSQGPCQPANKEERDTGGEPEREIQAGSHERSDTEEGDTDGEPEREIQAGSHERSHTEEGDTSGELKEKRYRWGAIGDTIQVGGGSKQI